MVYTLPVTIDAKIKLTEDEIKLLRDRDTNAEGLAEIAGVINNSNAFLKEISNAVKEGKSLEGDSGTIATRTKKLGMARQGLGMIGDETTKILKDTYSVIEDVHKRLVQASPLLQSIESLFNLATQLFFMPLGTKLATEMLPAVLDLVDSVMEIWDGFEGKTLGELMEETIELGAEIFGEYFQNLGKQLADEGGILGSIGKTLNGLGDFIEHHGESLLNLLANLMTFVMENLSTLVGLVVAIKTTQAILGLAQLAATAGAKTPIIGTIIGAGIVAGATAGLATSAAMSAEMSSYTPSTNVPRGEGIMTNSTTNNSFYINGYTDSDLKDKITSVINDNVNLGRLRGGMS